MYFSSSQNEIEDGKSGYKCYFEAGIGKKVCPSSYFLVFFSFLITYIFDMYGKKQIVSVKKTIKINLRCFSWLI